MDRVIFEKAAAYCSYQERSHKEVRDRLRKWNVWGEEADEIIAALITENFLSEERFARSFAGGKSRMKQWGRKKIMLELQRKGVSRSNIEAGLNEIGESDYKLGLVRLLEKKKLSLERTETDRRLLRQKLMRFAMGKGYEMELVAEVISELFEGTDV